MQRTKEWWGRLTKEERARLHSLEKNISKRKRVSIKFYPCYCVGCDRLCLKHLCSKCSNELSRLINKANNS